MRALIVRGFVRKFNAIGYQKFIGRSTVVGKDFMMRQKGITRRAISIMKSILIPQEVTVMLKVSNMIQPSIISLMLPWR